MSSRPPQIEQGSSRSRFPKSAAAWALLLVPVCVFCAFSAIKSNHAADQCSAVLSALNKLVTGAASSASHARSYVAGGDPSYKTAYYAAVDSGTTDLEFVQSHTLGNGNIQAEGRDTQVAFQAEFSKLDLAIEACDKGNKTKAMEMLASPETKQLVADLTEKLADMRSQEAADLRSAKTLAQRFEAACLVSFLTLFVIPLLLVLARKSRDS
jgi:CHASE3 domain sensor protein